MISDIMNTSMRFRRIQWLIVTEKSVAGVRFMFPLVKVVYGIMKAIGMWDALTV
jgi:hypothetical protein